MVLVQLVVLFFMQLLHQINHLDAFIVPCNESVLTMKRATKCPSTLSSYKEAAKRKNCLSWAAETKHCRSFEYHCVLSDDFQFAIEVCAPSIMIIGTVCAMFNTDLRAVMRIDSKKCEACPYSYNSTYAFQYSECYANITDNVTTTIMPRTISDEDDNSGALAALGSFVTVLSIVILVLILRLVYFRYRKKKQDTSKDNDESNQPMFPASNHGFSTEIKTSKDYGESHQPVLPASNHGFRTEANTPKDNKESNQPMLPASKHGFSKEIKCVSHDKYVSEIYCKDCSISICTTCVTGDHRQHNFTLLEDFLEERKAEFSNEIQEIESTVLTKFEKQKQEYENTIEAISKQENLICNTIRETGRKLKEQLTQIRKENITNANKNALGEEELVNIIKETKALLSKNDPKEILQFKGVKCQIHSSSVVVKKRLPVYQIKHLEKEEIQSMFGALVDNEDSDEVIGGENLKKQAWFHGYISREEADQLMKRDGDFLVRKLAFITEQDHYVICTFWNRPFHFKIHTAGVIASRVGRRATLFDLINLLVTSGEAVSEGSSSILKFPVDRNQHQLYFDQIKLGPKIENMQRGQALYNGTFANKAVLVISSDEEIDYLFKNVNLLRFFDHPNIVRLEGYSALSKPVLLLMENMSGGPLLTYLRSNGTSLSTRKRTEMCRDVANGMAYLHKNKFIHRDVAARNCLVHDGGVVKIYNFWLTEKGEEYQITETTEKAIPVKWTAPEALVPAGSFTRLSDIWSFGILMWEIFSSGLLPYQGLSNKESTEKVLKGYRMKTPDNTPESCLSLMLKCWEENPTKRGNFDEIVEKLQTIVQKNEKI